MRYSVYSLGDVARQGLFLLCRMKKIKKYNLPSSPHWENTISFERDCIEFVHFLKEKKSHHIGRPCQPDNILMSVTLTKYNWTDYSRGKVVRLGKFELPGLSGTCLRPWAGVGLVGRRAAGEPCPVACAGVGFPGRKADGVNPLSISLQRERIKRLLFDRTTSPSSLPFTVECMHVRNYYTPNNLMFYEYISCNLNHYSIVD